LGGGYFLEGLPYGTPHGTPHGTPLSEAVRATNSQKKKIGKHLDTPTTNSQKYFT
jgi:hypothetical protein